MRLLLCCLLFCCWAENSLLAQLNYLEWTEDEDSERRRLLRAGVQFQRDQVVYQNYVWDANLLVPTFRRNAIWSGHLHWQGSALKDYLFVLLEGNYLSDEIVLTDVEERAFRNSSNVRSFREEIDYRRFTLGLGIQIEPFYDYRLSPYFTGKFLLTVPTHLDYRYSALGNVFGNDPVKTRVSGGATISPGWEISAGFRSYLSSSVILSLGIYYQELDQRTIWPELDFRAYGDTIFRFNRSGLSTSLTYEW